MFGRMAGVTAMYYFRKVACKNNIKYLSSKYPGVLKR
jgi:hypothetical protein